MTNSPSAMPGAFNFPSHSNTHTTRPGSKSHLFQPPAPRTPGIASTESSVMLSRSTASLMSLDSNGIRTGGAGGGGGGAVKKRTLDDYTGTPRSYVDLGYVSGNWAPEDTGMVGLSEAWIPSPQPFVSERYEVRAGLDTPGRAIMGEEPEMEYSDVGYRKSLGVDRGLGGGGGFFNQREGNGRGRYSSGYASSPRPGEGWKTGILEVVGGVMGKVWNFCSGAVFKGFQAGGGTRYGLNNSTSHPSAEAAFVAIAPDPSDFWESEKAGGAGVGHRESTPVPGRFPEEDFIPDYFDARTNINNSTPSPPRAAKRRQISGHNVRNEQGEITKNWVVVPPTTTTHTSKATPKPRATYTMPTASSTSRRSIVPPTRPGRVSNPVARRPTVAKASFTGSPSLYSRPTHASTPSLSSRTAAGGGGSHAGSPALNSHQGASFASPRSPASMSKAPKSASTSTRNNLFGNNSTGINGGKGVESPAAKDARLWKAKKAREDREADEKLGRLDRQLRDLIRQGTEALGTKVEVEMMDDVDLDADFRRSGLGSGRASPTKMGMGPRSRPGRSNTASSAGTKKWNF